MPRFLASNRRRWAVVVVALAASAGVVSAASDTWVGTTDSAWTTTTNWSGGTPPGSTETATFNGAGNGNRTIDLGSGGVTVGSIFFDTASAAAYTIGAGGAGAQTLTLDTPSGTDAITLSSTVANNQVVDANILANTADNTLRLVNSSSTNSLTINGTIQGGTGTKQRTINVWGNVILNGAVSAGSASSAPNLALVSAGTLTMGGSATSTLNTLLVSTGNGLVVVDGPTVNVASSSRYGGSGTGVIGRFELRSGAANFNGGITFDNTSSSGGLLKVSGGAFTATSASFARTGGGDGDSATTPASSNAGLVVTGGTALLTGNLSLNGSNSSATGLVDGGSLTVNGTTTVANGTTGRWYRLEVRSGSFTSTDTGNGIILAASASSAQKAALLLTGGTATVEKISFGTATTNVGSFGTVTLNGASAALYLGSGGMVQGAGEGYTSTINLANGILGAKADWSSSLNMNLTGGGVTIKAADASDVAKNISLSGVLAGSYGFAKTGGGVLALANANTFSGTLTQSAGTVRLDHELAAQNATVSVGTTNGLTFGTGITAATIAGLTGSGDLGLSNNDSNAVSLSVGNGNTTSAYAGALSGSGSITKIGTGTFTVSNTGNTAAFSVTGGTLRGGGTADWTNGGFGSGAIALKGGTISSAMGSGDTLVFVNPLTVATDDTGTFNTPKRMSWSGDVFGGGTLSVGVSTDVSRLDLNNNWNGFTGTVNFTGSGGVRLVNNGGDFNTGSFQNATVDLAGTVNFQPQTNSGGNTYPIGALSGSSATAALGGGSAGTANYSVGGLNTSTSFAGQITGNSALTKTGSGTLTLTGANTYTGSTVISAGAVALSGSGSIANSAVITVGTAGSSGTVLDVSGLTSGAQTGDWTLGAGQKLMGIGTVTTATGGTITIAGTHAPGNSPGIQPITGNLSYADDSIFEWDLAASKNADGLNGDDGVAGTDFDGVTATGDISVTGATFRVNLASSVLTATHDTGNSFWNTPYGTQTWNMSAIFGKGFTSGSFASVTTNQDVSPYGSFTIDGSALTWTAVPELSNLLIGGLLGVGMLRRGRKAES